MWIEHPRWNSYTFVHFSIITNNTTQIARLNHTAKSWEVPQFGTARSRQFSNGCILSKIDPRVTDPAKFLILPLSLGPSRANEGFVINCILSSGSSSRFLHVGFGHLPKTSNLLPPRVGTESLILFYKQSMENLIDWNSVPSGRALTILKPVLPC